jgi:hypothetical protein
VGPTLECLFLYIKWKFTEEDTCRETKRKRERDRATEREREKEEGETAM